MIVVSDTSPLTNLAAIGKFQLLQALYGEIHIPNAVWNELHFEGKKWPGAREVEQSSWIHRHTVHDERLVQELLQELDYGEAEGITLALELKADLVLMDEQLGRHAAQARGLKVVGAIGVLIAAKSAGAIELLRPHLDALRNEAGFYIGDSLYGSVLKAAGE